jgi:hypothetical protein
MRVPIVLMILLGATSLGCCREVENQFDGGYILDAGDAGLPKADKGCPLDQVYNGICWCEPHFSGCPPWTEFCFYSSFYAPDAGCIHVDCVAGPDDDHCGYCDVKCKSGTHCSDADACVAD